jgi:hypothetical protein
MADSYHTFMRSEQYKRIQAAGLRVHKRGFLRWLIAQLDRPMQALSPGELQDLVDEVFGVIGAWNPDDYQLAQAGLDAAELQRLFGHVHEALVRIWGEGVVQPWTLPDEVWPTLTVTKMMKLPKKDRGYSVPGRLELGLKPKACTVRSLFLAVAMTALLSPQALAIRRCAWDGTWFLRVKSQRYCSARCTQAAMNAGKPGRKRKAPFRPTKPQGKKSEKRNQDRPAPTNGARRT